MRYECIFACIGILAVSPALGQTAPVKGTIGSASAQSSPGGTGTATVYTTPASGSFVLTQFCTNGGADLQGSSFGYIASISGGAGGQCVSFRPGFALPPNEQIQCVFQLANACSIAWVLEQ